MSKESDIDRAYRERVEIADIFAKGDEYGAIAATLRRQQHRALVMASDGMVPDRICWMPAGTHSVVCRDDHGEPWSGTITCDEETARVVQASFEAFRREGWSAYTDYAHVNGAASGWVDGFSWEAGVGVMASVRWTDVAKSVIRAQRFVSFSPDFAVAREGAIRRVVGLNAGRPVGGIVNAPAFAAMPPLLSLHGRDAAAALMREHLVAAGHSQKVADAVAGAVARGADGAAVRLVLQTLSAG